MPRPVSAFLLVIIVMSAANAFPLRAAEPGRVLNGHEFMASEIVRAPFVISFFSSQTGGGMAIGLETPYLDLGDESLGTLEGDVAFMKLGFRYQQRFTKWLAANLAYGGSGRFGVEGQSVMAQGMTGTFGFKYGVKARILQTEKTIFSGGLDFAHTHVVGLDPFGYAEQIIDEGFDAENNELVDSGHALSGRLSLLAGWAPVDWLGLTGYMEAGRGEIPAGDIDFLLGGGASAGIDLKNLDLIPLGIQFVGRIDEFTQNGADISERSYAFGVGLFYTGWNDFSIGVETTMNLLKRRGEGNDFEAYLATINLRYWP